MAFRRLEVWAVRLIRDETPAVERSYRADTIRHRGGGPKRDRAAHAVTLRPHLAVLRDGRLRIQPSDERFRIRHMRRLVQATGERHDLLNVGRAARWGSRGFLGAIERIDDEH